jgi:intein/homing endonuclease
MLLDIKEDVQTNNDNTYQILETKLKNGMDQKKDVNGIKNILNIYMTRLKEIVQNVVKNIKHISKMVIPSVLINVNQNSEEKVESIISREHVLNAVKNSSHIDIIKQNLVEVEIVNIHCSSKQNQRVYDLTVEDDHEYIANDILVHNCDAVRYFCMEIFGKKKNVASSEVF